MEQKKDELENGCKSILTLLGKGSKLLLDVG